MFGYTADEIRDTSVLSYLEEEDRLAVEKLSKSDRERFSFEVRIYSKDGSVKWLNWNVVHRDGLWFANARDITQQKKTDREIKQLNADLESFSYSISHDLRAPLRSINGYSHIILEDHEAQLNEEVRRLLEKIRGNAIRMGVLIDNLLEFSRLGRRRVTKFPVNLTELVQRVVDDLDEDHRGKARIHIGSLPATEGDPVLLYQVIVNLVTNAIKYSRKKEAPEIEIGSSENDGEYIYFVKDNGAGFNMDYAHKLFGVFQRLHGNEEFEGTGVGLAIVQRIIVKHGGRVWAEGRPDGGATFFFSLPKPATEKQDQLLL
jgi:light-regulated signal transduction histidine kinase (bacteriophytochrome)